MPLVILNGEIQGAAGGGSGSGTGTGWAGSVTNFAALPAATGSGDVYLVENSTGFLWNKRKGLYIDDGVGTWNRLSNATFQVLDTEAKFIDDGTSNELTFELSSLTGNRIATWQDKATTVAHDDDLIHKAIAAEFAALTLKGTPSGSDLILIEDAADSNNKKYITIGTLPTAGGGEANTASNAGSGTSLFYQKTGIDLELNGIKSENGLLTVALDGATHDIELTVNEGSIDHTAINNIGTNSHATIDTHISSTANPHTVTKAQVGLTNVTDDAQLKIASNLSDVNDQQTALDNVTAVSGATNEHVLTKDTATGNAIWKVSDRFVDTDTVNSSVTKTVATKLKASFNTWEWYVEVENPTTVKFSSQIVSVTQNGTDIKYVNKCILGDPLDYDVTAKISGANVELDVENNEANLVNVKIKENSL